MAYSVAFRTWLLASQVMRDPALRTFALEHCLRPLNQFKMREDRNGVATRGLLYMEKSWDTAYLWENAEAALAYFEAAAAIRDSDPARSREYELNGLVILRACAKHHYGAYGFLTEGVDWNDHVGQKHHIEQAKYGAIRYTEPFLNNQHIHRTDAFLPETPRASEGHQDGYRVVGRGRKPSPQPGSHTCKTGTFGLSRRRQNALISPRRALLPCEPHQD